MRITEIAFAGFRDLRKARVEFGAQAMLVGSARRPVIGALRLLRDGIEFARRQAPVALEEGGRPGYPLSDSRFIFEKIWNRRRPPVIIFTTDARVELRIEFFQGWKPHLQVSDAAGRSPGSPAEFTALIPLELFFMPPLRPVAPQERRVSARMDATGEAAPERFRSHWLHHPEEFPAFAAAVARTWRGFAVQPPRVAGRQVRMPVRCAGRSCELHSTPHAFQVWCQLVTHLRRAAPGALVVIDDRELLLTHRQAWRRLRRHLEAEGTPFAISFYCHIDR